MNSDHTNNDRNYDTVYFVTTGVSLSEQSRCWLAQYEDVPSDFYSLSPMKLFEDEELRDYWALNRSSIDECLREVNGAPNADQAAENARDMVEQHFDFKCWTEPHPRALPAEVNTIAKMCERGIFSDRDSIRLLWGRHQDDTIAPGNIAEAHLICAMLKYIQGEDRRCRLSGVDIILHPDGFSWAPTSQSFREAMDAVREVYAPYLQDGIARFVLTGGYKGVILDIAMKISWEICENKGTRVYYIHEDGDRLVTLTINEDGSFSSSQ